MDRVDVSPAQRPEPGQAPLAGIRVVEACSVLSGPITCRILADYGADVIKLEHPNGGDVLRETGWKKGGKGVTNEVVNRNKRSLAVYLGDPRGAEVLTRLSATADVVVENFRPGTLERWGVDYDILAAGNPGLILAHVSGFGQGGTYAQHAAFGTIAECMSGFADLVGPIGGEPTLGTFGLADNVAANAAVIGILLALWTRDRNGGFGQEVDCTLLGPMLGITSGAIAWAQQLDREVERSGNKSRNSAPRNTYQCSDGRWVGLAAQTSNLAKVAVEWAGRHDLVEEEWFGRPADRAANGVVDACVAAKVRSLPREQVLAECRELGLPAGPVYSPMDITGDKGLLRRNLLVDYEHPDLGTFLMPGLMADLSAYDHDIVRSPAPSIGADTDTVLTELGYSPQDVERLRIGGVVA